MKDNKDVKINHQSLFPWVPMATHYGNDMVNLDAVPLEGKTLKKKKTSGNVFVMELNETAK